MMKGWTASPRASRLFSLAASSHAGMKRAGGSRTSWRRRCRRSIMTAQVLTRREEGPAWARVVTHTLVLSSWFYSLWTLKTRFPPNQRGLFHFLYSRKDTYYRPSLVHPALVMYSAPGNRLVKGTGSTFSCVRTIWWRNNTELTFEHLWTASWWTIKFMALNKDSLSRDCLSWFLLFWE